MQSILFLPERIKKKIGGGRIDFRHGPAHCPRVQLPAFIGFRKKASLAGRDRDHPFLSASERSDASPPEGNRHLSPGRLEHDPVDESGDSPRPEQKIHLSRIPAGIFKGSDLNQTYDFTRILPQFRMQPGTPGQGLPGLPQGVTIAAMAGVEEMPEVPQAPPGKAESRDSPIP